MSEPSNNNTHVTATHKLRRTIHQTGQKGFFPQQRAQVEVHEAKRGTSRVPKLPGHRKQAGRGCLPLEITHSVLLEPKLRGMATWTFNLTAQEETLKSMLLFRLYSVNHIGPLDLAARPPGINLEPNLTEKLNIDPKLERAQLFFDFLRDSGWSLENRRNSKW